MWNGGRQIVSGLRSVCRRSQRRSQGSTEAVSVASLFPNGIRQQLWPNHIGDGAHPMEPEGIHARAYGRTRDWSMASRWLHVVRPPHKRRALTPSNNTIQSFAAGCGRSASIRRLRSPPLRRTPSAAPAAIVAIL